MRAGCRCGRGRGGQGEGGCRGRRSEGERDRGWKSKKMWWDVGFMEKRAGTDNVQVEQHLGESDSRSNINLVRESLSDPTLNAFDIDNLVLNDNVKYHFSTKEELQDDGNEDDGGGGGDIGDDLIRGLMNN
ncbi:hypothetical protein HKD37_10G028466 [Glycine soja]